MSWRFFLFVKKSAKLVENYTKLLYNINVVET